MLFVNYTQIYVQKIKAYLVYRNLLTYMINLYTNCEKGKGLYSPLFCSNYFHKKSTLFEKSVESCSFFMNTAMSKRRLFVSPRKKSRLGDFSPNYFEYRLIRHHTLPLFHCRSVFGNFRRPIGLYPPLCIAISSYPPYSQHC